MKYLYPALAVIVTACVIIITVKVLTLKPQTIIRVEGYDNTIVREVK